MLQAKDECEVLVIGAGPTGLMAAVLLKRCGIDVRIVDQRAAPSSESRAFAVSGRSLELFASLGLAERLLARGAMTSGIDILVSGKRVGGLDYDRVDAADAPYRFILMAPQSETEAVLIQALEEAGLAVLREVEVTGIAQGEERVAIAARGPSGESVGISARYVLGADGAHSVVRSSLGLSFHGAKYPQSFLLGDVEVEWPLDHGRFRVFMHGERIGLFFPLQGSRLSRVMTTDLGGEGGDAPAQFEPLELADLQSAFADASCQQVRLHNPTWLTRFRTHHRAVDRYREGRVFVAGDAAHIHSPAGGQGMNTGLQDAANLAWKLVEVLRNGAADALLDTYGIERLPVARDVLRLTDRLFGIAAGQSGWRAQLRDMLASAIVGPASSLDAVQTAAFRKLSQIDISYPESQVAAPGAGMRVPNAALSRHGDLFALLAGYCWHLLLLSRTSLEARAADGVLSDFGRCAAEGVQGHLLVRDAGGRREGVKLIESADVFDRFDMQDPDARATILVRPDGYIAWQCDGFDPQGALAFMRQLRH